MLTRRLQATRMGARAMAPRPPLIGLSLVMASVSDRRTSFRQLHESGCFVIPNPWDVGSARLLAQLGFPALATTSSGFAWTLGRPDNGVAIAEALAHFRAIAEAVDIPVNADFQGGFAVNLQCVPGECDRGRRDGCRRAVDRGFSAMRPTRCSSSRSPSTASGRRARRSTTPARVSSSWPIGRFHCRAS